MATESTDLQRVKKRYARAKQIAEQWSSILESCYFYSQPERNNFYRTKAVQGEQKNQRLYDATPVEATEIFVSKLHNTLTPPQSQWGFLQVSDEWNDEPEDVRNDAQQVLNAYMRRLFSFINTSNFDVIVNEVYFDVAVGTGCLVINRGTDKKPLIFSSIPLDKLAIEEAADGSVKSWWRSWESLKINELQTRWPQLKLSDDLQAKQSLDPDATADSIKEGVAYMPNNAKPYRYIIWCGDDELLNVDLKTNPGIVWRFQKTNNEVFGRGPVMKALPSMASLNEMAKIELASANLNTFKPYVAFSDTVFNPHTFSLEPFSIIPIAPISQGGELPIQPLPGSADPQFAQLTIQDLRNQIKSLLFNDAPDTPSIQPQSKEALQQNQQELAEKIGPLFSRLQQEFLWPIIERCSDILDSMGLLPKPEIDNKRIQFVYRSPLALSKGKEDVQNIMQFIEIMQQVYGEQAIIYLNPTEVPWLLAEKLQINTQFLNTREGVAEAMQQLQQQQQEQQAQEQQQQQNEQLAPQEQQ